MKYNKENILKEFDEYLFSENEEYGQLVFKFDNNYGASLINHRGSYGNEIAVLYFDGDNWDITYSTHITDDVLGRLTEDEILEALKQIKELED